ncbi:MULTISPECIES: Bbp16 family capsid cement protein [unclassified Janthinobacterium]|uniref:Bbp16 family capsid cement protein n=1 Tax=unclassified Janthinobacterium TaxID=2610881 RepID=UPI000346B114|nr:MULTISPECIES: hypothetical protein [unclassified Janthinobacterium]MEC5161718.1 hypothetical protein [Janthinobacterium sp. CG_S6]
MILDNFLLLSGSVSAAGALTGQAVTATAVSTNTLDTNPLTLGANQPNDLGRGEPLEIAIGVTVAATAAGAATVTFEYIQADDAALTTNVEVICTTGPIGKATLVLGALVALHVDRASPLAPRRYVGLRYTVATGPLTAGSFTAAIVKNIADIANIYGKSGFAVL